MRFFVPALATMLLTIGAARAGAQVFGTVRVVARDPQSLPLRGAAVVIASKSSSWSQSATTDAQGEAVFAAVPVGQYTVSIESPGFAKAEQAIAVASNAVTPVAVQLAIAGVAQSVDVASTVKLINPESSRTETFVSRDDILHEPDADRSGSLAMITDNVPGAYVMHDHLHARGGHGVTWEIDGVPVPNSNLASVGSQFDPKDVDALEANRGGLSANSGDRSYGVFNIVPRSGFEDHRFGDVALSGGNFHALNGYASFGDHAESQRFAYFASAAANRTDRGLERVDIPVLHDDALGASGFTSIIFNAADRDQLRIVSSARTDHYQVPNTTAEAAIDDRETATDAFSNVTWVHTSDSGMLVTASPYYHFNRGQYIGGPADPLATSDDRSSHYIGGFVNVSMTRGSHTLRMGSDSFAERYSSVFGLTANDGSGLALQEREQLWATVASAFVEDTYRASHWLTINGGLRVQRFSGSLTENAATPRIGVAIALPREIVVRGSYSRYYQHPQVSTVQGPVLGFALREGFSFLPIAGERDAVWEAGVAVPLGGWTLDVDAFHNAMRNLVDHEVLGHSNLLLPLAIDSGRVRAIESTLRSPAVLSRLRVHYAVSYQSAQGRGAVTGGLTDFAPPADTYFYLDHDQRVTLSAGAELSLPRGSWISGSVLYGSGFLRGDGPDHMPQHATFDLAAGVALAPRLVVRATVLNVANSEYLTGIDNSFAGTHYANPREMSVQLRYKFHY